LWLRAGLLRLTSHNRAHFGAIWTHFEIPVPSMNMGSLLLSREAMHQQSGMPPGGPDQLLSPLLIVSTIPGLIFVFFHYTKRENL